MERREPLAKNDHSQVAQSIDVTVPGTGMHDVANNRPLPNWWIMKEMLIQ